MSNAVPSHHVLSTGHDPGMSHFPPHQVEPSPIPCYIVAVVPRPLAKAFSRTDTWPAEAQAELAANAAEMEAGSPPAPTTPPSLSWSASTVASLPAAQAALSPTRRSPLCSPATAPHDGRPRRRSPPRLRQAPHISTPQHHMMSLGPICATL